MSTMNDGKVWNLFFCGIGGQGVLKGAEVTGWAALYDGYHVKKSEVHGMSQRGGSVESHLRFGRTVYSPLIPEGGADYLIAFSPDEHERMKYYLSAVGVDLYAAFERSEKEVPDKQFRNTYVLGALSHYLPISEAGWKRALEEVFPGSVENNMTAFSAGRKSMEGVPV